ncbi:SDR family oxidoreductase [Nonomuraea sp. LPB2021202275-12-8]|uniref:SDR family oxidoreductase n=1 Tax=Nonomuraea sp. LPB2021202275-12-8 TaxID=3120159 RepID=UPI00300D6D49
MRDGKSALVTGAAGGIGSAVVGALRQDGYRVLALGRARLEELGDVTAIRADLARPEKLAAALPPIDELDAFVHCAGIAEVAATADSPVGLWQETLNVNVVSAAELLRLLLPALRRRRGRVVLVNAAPGLAAAGWPAYAASKAALRELADAVREEERCHGIGVTTVHPGGTATELLRKVRAAAGVPYDPARCLRPETVASLVLTAVTAPPDAHLTELSVRPAPVRSPTSPSPPAG